MAKLIFKDLLPRTLFWRSLLILITPVFLLQVIATYVFLDRHWSKTTDRLAFAVAGEIAIIADQVEQSASYENMEAVGRYYERTLDIVIDFRPGAILKQTATSYGYAGAWNSAVAEVLSDALKSQVRRPHDIHVDIDGKWIQVGVQLPMGVLIVDLPQRRLFTSTTYIFLLWMVGSSIVLLLIAVLFMRNQIRPIRRLAIAAERFGKGREIPFFKVEGAREVRQAGRAFLEMRERINRQIQQRTAMLAGVSHDLRTPLTRMKLQIEMMGDNEDVRELKSDIADMERMIAAYLDFARGEGEEQPVETDATEILRRVAAAARREGAAVSLTAGDDLTAVLRPLAFERCMTNLLGNGVKYGGTVDVEARRAKDHIEITVADNGPGIPVDMREEVFKPFFRGEASRNAKTGGVGLGLPIAQDIVLAHGGQIWLEDAPQGGLLVRVHLPA